MGFKQDELNKIRVLSSDLSAYEYYYSFSTSQFFSVLNKSEFCITNKTAITKQKKRKENMDT